MPLTLAAIAVFAVVKGTADEPIRAVELLALARTHLPDMTLWMEKWPLLIRLREDLKNELGEDAYNAAWERGKVLDLDTVVADLQGNFGS